MSALKSPLPIRKRSYRFALTPLADTMFQLLIFFMVSSSLTPYSLITLQSAPTEQTTANAQSQTPFRLDENAPTVAPSGAQTAAQGPVWHLLEGRVEAGGQEFAIDQLGELALALGVQNPADSVTLLLGQDARMQDVASAMAALQSAQITGIRIAREAAR